MVEGVAVVGETALLMSGEWCQHRPVQPVATGGALP